MRPASSRSYDAALGSLGCVWSTPVPGAPADRSPLARFGAATAAVTLGLGLTPGAMEPHASPQLAPQPISMVGHDSYNFPLRAQTFNLNATELTPSPRRVTPATACWRSLTTKLMHPE